MNKITTEISYQFSKVENPELDKFIIYPDEYANTEILKLKYELIINNKIYNVVSPYCCECFKKYVLIGDRKNVEEIYHNNLCDQVNIQFN